MPCRCDYMEPNKQEQDSKELAEIIILLYNEVSKPIPKFIKEASGRYYGMFGLENVVPGALNGTQALISYTVEACSILSNMDLDKKSKLLVENDSLRKWYDRHNAADLIRSKIETDSNYRESILKDALSKLTDEERIAIRFHFIDKLK